MIKVSMFKVWQGNQAYLKVDKGDASEVERELSSFFGMASLERVLASRKRVFASRRRVLASRGGCSPHGGGYLPHGGGFSRGRGGWSLLRKSRSQSSKMRVVLENCLTRGLAVEWRWACRAAGCTLLSSLFFVVDAKIWDKRAETASNTMMDTWI